MSATQASTSSIWSRVGRSFTASIGDIVFGMEDGTVSIFGLVFGVAAGAHSSAPVLLAGATGAISAAVSMMAGTYLDVESANDQARARLDAERTEVAQKPEEEAQEERDRLRAAGFGEQDLAAIVAALQRTPGAQLRAEAAFELGAGQSGVQNPLVQSIWMFLADLFAAFTPVVPFAVLALGPARLASVAVTAILLVVLGVGRGLVGHRSILLTVLETVGIAAAAAGAGFLISQLIARWTG